MKDLMSADIGTTHDDAVQGANGGGSGGGGGMSIGNSTPVINLNSNKPTKEDPRASMSEEDIKAMYAAQEEARYPKETPEETKPTQGEQTQSIQNAQTAIEKWNDFLESGKKDGYKDFIKHITADEAKIIKQYMKDNKITGSFSGADGNKIITDIVNHLMNGYRDTIYNTQTSPDYDPRTVEEQRQDTATQRASKDYIAAGLNPKALSGFTGGGGGGGGGNSKDDEEEKKRKRRREEREANRRAREAERMRQREHLTGVLSGLTNTATKAVGAGAFMQHQKTMQQEQQQHQTELQGSKHTHDRRMIESEKLAGNKKYRIDGEYGYYDKNGKWISVNID